MELTSVVLMFILLFICSTNCADLASKTADLKKQAVQILKKQGIKVDDAQMDHSSGTQWGDIEMTESLYEDVKKSFDEEELQLDNPKDEILQIASPDFSLTPQSKWKMPIPYSLGKITDLKFRDTIKRALNEIERKTCVRFYQTGNPQGSYIEYIETNNYKDFCGLAPIGQQPGKNSVHISCKTYGIVLHETLHVLGFHHTHQRPDADKYLYFYFNNIKRSERYAFKPWKLALEHQVSNYDYGSIMHYDPYAFAIDPKQETLLPKYDAKKNKALMGQRWALSSQDVQAINQIYCSRHATTFYHAYYSRKGRISHA